MVTIFIEQKLILEMKRMLSGFFVLFVVIGCKFDQKNNEPSQPATDFSNFQGCFQLEEREGTNKVITFISLKINGSEVTGEQAVEITGTEYSTVAGGTINGKRDGDVVTVTYAYEIEGSSQKEQQEFKLTYNALLMSHGPLEEVDGVLVLKRKGKFNKTIPKVDCP